MTSPLLPKYGIITWRDAAGLRKRRVPVKRTDLPLRQSIGQLFISVDGTLAIIHELDPQAKGLQRGCELTVVPMAWVELVTPLVPETPTPPPSGEEQ